MDLQKTRPDKEFCVKITGQGLRWSDKSCGSVCSPYVTVLKAFHLSVPKILMYRRAVISPHACSGPVISDRDYAQYRSFRPAIMVHRIKRTKHLLFPIFNRFSS